MPTFHLSTTSSFILHDSQNDDVLLHELILSMSGRPSPPGLKSWLLNYIPPKHLRLPEYKYDQAEEICDYMPPFKKSQTSR